MVFGNGSTRRRLERRKEELKNAKFENEADIVVNIVKSLNLNLWHRVRYKCTDTEYYEICFKRLETLVKELVPSVKFLSSITIEKETRKITSCCAEYNETSNCRSEE